MESYNSEDLKKINEEISNKTFGFLEWCRKNENLKVNFIYNPNLGK